MRALWRKKAEPEPSEGDRLAADAARHAAFLAQARWLLEQQHRRAATFQQTAVALVGFDGVLLALLISDGTIGASMRWSMSWWFGLVAAVMFAVSSIFGVLAIVPFNNYSVTSRQTREAWDKYLTEGGWDTSTYHFTHMLLAPNPPEQGHDRLPARFGRAWRALLGRKNPPTQPIVSSERLATRRGKLTAWSAWSILIGIFALAALLLTSPVNAGTRDPEPSQTPVTQITPASGSVSS
ncbi:MAG: hypothetical protein L6367_04660 [Cellulomonas sp.]|nr:hypothetical protein [Cellulomonas sp.]